MTDLRMPALERHLVPGPRILVVLGLGACHGADMGPDPDSGPPAHLEVVTGGGQTGTVGHALSEAVVARVTDADGRGVSGVLVTFAAAGAGGVFAPESRRTDEHGQAQAIWTLG